MRPIVLLTLVGAIAWESVASAQYGYGVPGGYFGSGGLYSGGGSSPGFPGSNPSGYGSGSSFRGFTYSPYTYSSPSYGLLSPTFGGASPNLGFGTPSGLGLGTSFSPGFVVPVYREKTPRIDFGAYSDRGRADPYRDLFGSDRFLSSGDMSFYATGFGCPPTWRAHARIRPW